MSWVITVESKVTHSDAHVCLNTTFLVSLFNIELTSFGGIAINMWILELFDVLVTKALCVNSSEVPWFGLHSLNSFRVPARLKYDSCN